MKTFTKKISVLLASAMLFGSLTACDNGKWKTEAQAALPTAFDDASIGKIYCQGEVISFPLKVKDMLDNGFKYPTNIKDIEDETLEYNWSTGAIEMPSKKSSSKTVEIKALNIESETLNLKDCWIEKMTFNSKSGNVMLPGAMELGQKYDSKEAFEAALPQSFLNDVVGTEYKATFESAEHFLCTMTIKAKESSGKYSVDEVFFESEYYYDAGYFLDTELKAAVLNDNTEYTKIFDDDSSAFAKEWRESAYCNMLYLYGFAPESITDEQYAKFDAFFTKIMKDVKWDFENAKDTLKVTFSYPNIDQAMEDAFNAAIDEYTKTDVTVDDMKVDQDLINAFCDEHNSPRLDSGFLQELAVNFKGLSEYEIKSILGIALSDDGVIDKSDLDMIFGQKQQLIQKSGILEMVPLKEGLEDIGGLESLKSWLQRKQKIFKDIRKAKQFGVGIPKGVLIAGMPGCGKSLNAKAAAKLFGVPLLRLDMGRLMGKYVGESEANMRKAIVLAEAISPCVLWIDELEKSFAGVGGEGAGNDISTRLFGTFLTWLQEKDSLAFVVATANNIVKLPPELLRKGRFDEIFYVGLPNEAERKKIFSIHIKKRRPNDLKNINVDKLVKLTKGYSGADIEGVVRDGVEEAFAKGKSCLDTEDIILAINNTHSLSEIMKDSLDAISKVYHDRKFKNASV